MGGHNKLNLVGQKFSRLTVVEEAGRKAKKEVLWLCECECGNKTEATTHQLRQKRIQSCGCLRVDEGRKTGLAAMKHGHGKDSGRSPTYGSWQAMKDRCLHPHRAEFKWYGAKGVTVCERWLNSFENFLADMGERPEGMTLDRINPFGNYDPDNCRWANADTQSKNTRRAVNVTIDGMTKNLREWSVISGIPYSTLHYRVRSGWDSHKILAR